MDILFAQFTKKMYRKPKFWQIIKCNKHDNI